MAGVLVAAVALIPALIVGGAATANAAGVFKPITNQADTTECMSATSGAVSAQVIEQKCNPSNPLQGWEFQKIGSSDSTEYTFLNESGFCLFAFSPPPAAGKPMGLNTCRSVSNEDFTTRGVILPGFAEIDSLSGFENTGFCVNAPGTDGAQLVLESCVQSNSETWSIPPQN